MHHASSGQGSNLQRFPVLFSNPRTKHPIDSDFASEDAASKDEKGERNDDVLLTRMLGL